MKELIEKFPEQLRKALEIAKSPNITPAGKEIKNVLIAGLGGSGIGGTIASEINMLECKVPVTVTKGYFLPEFVNENTLVIVSSYSGNTEETIQVMNGAIERNAKLVAITSGGIIAETAENKKFDAIILPGGMPPRTCLGYSLVQVLNVLFRFQLTETNPLPLIKASIDLLEKENSSILEEAKKITAFFKGKTPVIYSTTFHEGIAIRWRQQINENAKMLCWHHVIPEMNHNELVGWRNKNENLAVLYLLFNNEYDRNLKRIEMNKEVIKQYTSNIHSVVAKGNSEIEQTFYLNAIGDWVSYFLSIENGVEAAEINVINDLKKSAKSILMPKAVLLEDLGIIDYKKAWDYQEELHQKVVSVKLKNRELPLENQKITPNYLLFCEHPHVYTLGKSGSEENLLLDESQLDEKNASFYKINRGGDITYHGPGQLVVYPIFDLENFFTDIHKYLRFLEEAVMLTLQEYGIKAGRVDGLTGVWIEGENPLKARKICAMGVKCSRWITMHGIGFNINSDLSYFKNIIPCGIDDKAVTSLEKELGRKVDMDELKKKLLDNLANIFDFDYVLKEKGEIR